MGAPPRRFRSLRWHLTLPYIALLAVLLVGMDAAQYISLRHSLINSRVTTLTGDVDAARAAFLRGTGNGTAGAAVLRFANAVSVVSGRTVTVVIYDDRHRAVVTVPADATPPGLDAATLDSLTTGHSAPRVLDSPTGPQLVVAYGAALGTRRGVLELATPMDPITSVLDGELWLLAATSLAALVLALAVGLLLVGRGLRPLRRLTATAGELAAGDLSARTRLEHRSDEVGQLGTAVDEMADHLETAFNAQKQSEAQVRRFIADASHELRTPVTSLKGYIDVLRRGAGRDAESLEAILGSMQREADRMRTLVLDLLTLARLDSAAPVQHEPFNLDAVIARVLDDGVPGMPAVLDRHLDATGATVFGDADSVATVARNLLVNACKYAPGAPQSWTTTETPMNVVLTVHDAGPGIDAADLPHVFDRFYRGEKTRAREEGGSGLGLSIVQGLVRGMGGDVRIDSRGGGGTTVTVTLPKTPAARG